MTYDQIHENVHRIEKAYDGGGLTDQDFEWLCEHVCQFAQALFRVRSLASFAVYDDGRMEDE